MRPSKFIVILSLTVLVVSSCCLFLQRVQRQEIAVNCDAGESLAEALKQSSGNETFVVLGDCKENAPIVVNRNGVTIDGNGGTIDAQGNPIAVILVQGVEDTIVRDVELTGGRIGIHVDSQSMRTALNRIRATSNATGVLIGNDVPVEPFQDEILKYKGIKKQGRKLDQQVPHRAKRSQVNLQRESGGFGIVSILNSVEVDLISSAMADGCRERVDGAVVLSELGAEVEICDLDTDSNLTSIDVTAGLLIISQQVNLTGPGTGISTGLAVRSSGRVNFNSGANVIEQGNFVISDGVGFGLVTENGTTISCTVTDPPSVSLVFNSGVVPNGTNAGCTL